MPNSKLAFVASDFAAYENTSKYMNIFSDLFASKGIVFSERSVIDYRISSDKARAVIGNAEVVWLSGGDTLKQIQHIKKYGLIDTLQKCEGITIGMSAGSIKMAKRVILARDVRENIMDMVIYDGIGLVDYNIEPHLDFSLSEHIGDIIAASKIEPIYGLFDESFIVIAGDTFSIHGEYYLFD